MSKNRFYKSFKSKTDSELNELLNNPEKYTSEALDAATLILNERSNLIKKEGKATNETQITTDSIPNKAVIEKVEKTEAKKKSYLTDDPSAPQLHSKQVILIFSFLFSTIFGAVLMMYNMEQVKNRNAKHSVLAFGVVYTALVIFVVNYFNIYKMGYIFHLVGASILTDFFWNKFIGKERYYRKRSWLKPAIISVIIAIPFIISMIYT